jgi:hypothetical protein
MAWGRAFHKLFGLELSKEQKEEIKNEYKASVLPAFEEAFAANKTMRSHLEFCDCIVDWGSKIILFDKAYHNDALTKLIKVVDSFETNFLEMEMNFSSTDFKNANIQSWKAESLLLNWSRIEKNLLAFQHDVAKKLSDKKITIGPDKESLEAKPIAEEPLRPSVLSV